MNPSIRYHLREIERATVALEDSSHHAGNKYAQNHLRVIAEKALDLARVANDSMEELVAE